MFVSLEGNIGAGKSTLISCFKQFVKDNQIHDIHFCDEPLDLWTNYYVDKSNRGIFDYYYHDPSRWAFTFQFIAMKTRYDTYTKALKSLDHFRDHVFVFERSIFADYIFAKILYSRECMNDIEYKIYTDWFDFFYRQLEKPFGGQKYVYIDTTPEECLNRIHQRNRKSEENIDLPFLQQLTGLHQQWFQTKELDKYHFDRHENPYENDTLDKHMTSINGHDNFHTNPDTTIYKILDFIYESPYKINQHTNSPVSGSI